MQIQCSRCGKRKSFAYTVMKVAKVIADGWGTLLIFDGAGEETIINEKLFPSIRPLQSTTLKEILEAHND